MQKIFLFVVEERFLIRGRGLILAPGIAQINHARSGDIVELRKPDGTRTQQRIKGVERMNYQLGAQIATQTYPLILDATDQDIPQGTEVWRID